MDIDFFQPCDEMEPPPEDGAEREWVERRAPAPRFYPQTARREQRPPLPPALVVARHGHAVRTVPHPVHQPQRGEVKAALAQMVLDQHVPPADTRRLVQ